jgi:hypothetical protein
MPIRSYNVRFPSIVHITKDLNLPENYKCLEAILQNADLEVEVEINAEIDPGPRWDPSWDGPGPSAQAIPTHYKILNVEINANTQECSKTIELLMTNEQREAIKEAAELIIDYKWEEDYKYQALSSQ